MVGPSVHAQVSTASQSVKVVGEDGDSLGEVTVEARNTETGLERSAVTDLVGIALIPGLSPGPYSVDLHLEGMASLGRQEIVLIAGQRGVVHLKLSHQVSDVVTVISEAPVVDPFRLDSATNVVPE